MIKSCENCDNWGFGDKYKNYNDLQEPDYKRCKAMDESMFDVGDGRQVFLLDGCARCLGNSNGSNPYPSLQTRNTFYCNMWSEKSK